MLGLGFRALHLIRITNRPKIARKAPNFRQWSAEKIALQLNALGIRDAFETWIGSIKLEKFRGPHGEHGAALKNLNFYTHLKHVSGWSHRHVSWACFGQHSAHEIR